MVKKSFLLLVCVLGLIIFVSLLHGQGSKKTITLPNGDAVWDLNGDWDSLYESGRDKVQDIVSITQQGGSFVGVKVIGTPDVPKGAVVIKGELDKNGVKKAVVTIGPPGVPAGGGRRARQEKPSTCACHGKISEDGNKMILECCEFVKRTLTLTRK